MIASALACVLLSLGATPIPIGLDRQSLDDARRGRVVLAAGEARLAPEIAREMGGAERLCLTIRGTAPGVDPLASCGAPARSIEFDLDRPFPGDDRARCAAVEESRCLVLAGASWVEWYALLRPGKRESELARAIENAHRAGATVVGQGGAAGYLAEWAPIERASLARVERNPHRSHPDVLVAGAGLARGFALDFDRDARPNPARFLALAAHAGVRVALWLEGPVALECDARGGAVRVHGPGAAIVYDLRGARRSRAALHGGRATLVAAGGAIDLERGVLLEAGARREGRTPARASDALRDADLEHVESIDGEWRLAFERDGEARWNGAGWSRVAFAIEPRER